ncbi:DUF4352 domain-containing protein [Mycobacterium kansasii]|uniref:DUF4352 domain-containing protein n=1 Tax=Mycobacterium kansasii TaxID=1768 RepID=UPI0015E1E9CA|nr:DUF4352 domain-containing protein [Mycobacterium kansasii]
MASFSVLKAIAVALGGIAIAAAVLLMAGCRSVGNGAVSSPASQIASPSAPAPVGTGQVARDGGLAFTVQKVDPPQSYIGDIAAKQGQFLVVHLNVRNVGTETQIFFATEQKLRDAAGYVYPPTDDGMFAENKVLHGSPTDPNPLMQSLSPGDQFDTVVVFDLPSTVRPTSIELHVSPVSVGTKVNLS